MDMAQRVPADAKARVEAFVQRVPNNASAHVLLADIAEASGESPVTVLAHLANAVRADPQDAGAHLALINRNLRLQDKAAALAAAQAAVAALPDNTSLGMALGRAQLAAGDARQATTTFNKLAAASPPGRGVDVQLALSEAAIALSDFAGARRALQRALEIDPDLASARRGLAVLAVREGRIDEALALATEMQRRQPKSALGYMVEGDIELQRQNWSAAAKAFRKSLDLSGASEVAIKLHHALSGSARPDEASAFAATWEKQRPNDPAFHFYLGDSFTQRGDHASAERHYRRVLLTQPDSALALNNIAWAMHMQSKPGALDVAQKANTLMPGQAPILDTLSTIQAAAGQWPEAVKTQQQAVNRSPDDAGLRLKLARYLLKTGSKDEARLHLETLARLGDRFPQQSEVAGLLKGL
jgi:putative PEP-CTERM system TPR-repeat lipoprotein